MTEHFGKKPERACDRKLAVAVCSDPVQHEPVTNNK